MSWQWQTNLCSDTTQVGQWQNKMDLWLVGCPSGRRDLLSKYCHATLTLSHPHILTTLTHSLQMSVAVKQWWFVPASPPFSPSRLVAPQHDHTPEPQTCEVWGVRVWVRCECVRGDACLHITLFPLSPPSLFPLSLHPPSSLSLSTLPLPSLSPPSLFLSSSLLPPHSSSQYTVSTSPQSSSLSFSYSFPLTFLSLSLSLPPSPPPPLPPALLPLSSTGLKRISLSQQVQHFSLDNSKFRLRDAKTSPNIQCWHTSCHVTEKMRVWGCEEGEWRVWGRRVRGCEEGEWEGVRVWGEWEGVRKESERVWGCEEGEWEGVRKESERVWGYVGEFMCENMFKCNVKERSAKHICQHMFCLLSFRRCPLLSDKSSLSEWERS